MRRLCALIVLALSLWAPQGCDNGKSPTGYGSVDYHSSDGVRWRLDTIAVGQVVFLNGIWGASPSQVYVSGIVGDSLGLKGVVWRYDGSHWREFYSREHVLLQGIFGLSSQSIWVAGVLDPDTREGALVLHWNGWRWVETLSDPTSPGLLKVWARNDRDVYAVGNSGVIFHFNGVRWQKESPPEGTWNIYDVWGRVKRDGSEEIYAGTSSGTVLRKTTAQWDVSFSEPHQLQWNDFTGVWASPDGPVYALEVQTLELGCEPKMYILNGTRWDRADFPGESWCVSALRGDATNHLYAVGFGVSRFDGITWSRYTDLPPIPGLEGFNDVWSSGTDVFICASAYGIGSYVAGAVLVTDFSVKAP